MRKLLLVLVAVALALFAYRRAHSAEAPVPPSPPAQPAMPTPPKPSRPPAPPRPPSLAPAGDFDKDTLRVTIDSDGNVALNGEPATLATLKDEVVGALKRDKSLRVVVDADKLAAYGTIADVAEALKNGGAVNIDVRVASEKDKAVAPAKGETDSARAKFLKGEWPGDDPKITLELDHERVRNALKAIADKAGWTLLVRERPHGRVDLSAKDLPADEAMLLVLKEADEVVAERQGKVVTIRSMSDEEQEAAGEEETSEAEGHGHTAGSKDDRVSFGGSVEVAQGETVRDAVSMGGNVTVRGTVLKDAVSMGGNVHVAPTGRVLGDAVSMGGSVVVDPGGRVGGQKTNMGGPNFGKAIMKARPFMREHHDHEPAGFFSRAANWLLGLVTTFVVLFVISLLVHAFAPARVRVVGNEMLAHPAPAGLVGLLVTLAVIPLTLILVITVVGWIVPPLAVFAALCLGFTALVMQVGQRLPFARSRRTPVVVMAMGAALIAVASAVPILGTLVMVFLSVLCLGAVVRTRFGNTGPLGPPSAPEPT